MPKVSKEYLENIKEQIMLAALNCVARKGFHQTTMRDICKEAKLSIGAVYNHFKSKEEILAEMTIKGQQAKEFIFQKVNECQNAREGLRVLFQYLFDAYKNEVFKTYGSIDLETYGEATRNEEIRQIMLKEFQSLMTPLAEFIRRWQGSGEIRTDIDANYLANYLIAVSVGIKIHLLIQSDLTADGFEDVMEKVFLETIWSG
jgi:AcrR family transcriptional regulator